VILPYHEFQTLSIFSITCSLLISSFVPVNLFFSSEENKFVIPEGSLDNNFEALSGSAFLRIVLDTGLGQFLPDLDQFELFERLILLVLLPSDVE
jgi:hypothetical protein